MKEVERLGYHDKKELWSAQYLPADDGEEERRVRVKWLGQEMADELERDVVRGHGEREGKGPVVEIGGIGHSTGGHSAAWDERREDDHTQKSRSTRPKKVFVQSSLFAGVMLNIQHKYGVNVGLVLERLYSKDTSQDQPQYLGMSGLQAAGHQRDALRIVPDTGERSANYDDSGMQSLERGSVLEGQKSTRAQEEIQSMMRCWEAQYPGILSGKGRHLLSVDLRLMDDLEPVLQELGVRNGNHPGHQPSHVIGKELEMEARRRRHRQLVFRGVDGSREVFKLDSKSSIQM
ncbi:hypothetical protein BDZ85DRAFT_255658 [Elsinoe ampelina]|uniref:Uncharacterized protein n=1 Tax=Elsinoe ampelina TaxID=302913 RepID=A0A6A6GRC1_9PEZI|nr:hypothetical protein BDZ85DRAFT_255658 [Elsinoe ampelina]